MSFCTRFIISLCAKKRLVREKKTERQLDKRDTKNKKEPLGFLNPMLYHTGTSKCYRDISDYSENFCHQGTAGFKSVKGWDAASGFGSVNAECMINLLS